MNKKELTITINPEILRFYAFGFFWMMTIVAIPLTLIFNPDTLEDNPILEYFGVNNICVFFDTMPARGVLPTLWPISMVCFFLYYMTTFLQQYAFYKDRLIGTIMFISRSISIGIGILAIFYFSTIFAIPPEESILQHSIPFLCLILSLSLFSVNNLSYYSMVSHLNPAFYYYLLSFNIVLIGTTIIYVAHIITSLFHFSILPFQTNFSVDKLWMVLNSFFPMLHALYLKKHTPPMRLKLSY